MNKVKLPAKEEMLKRLLAVDSEVFLQEQFYPRLLKLAGKEIAAVTIVMSITLAIEDSTKGQPFTVARVLQARMPEFIDALMVDKNAAKEAKAFLSKI